MDKTLDIRNLYNLRMFVFLETDPQSNKYMQVMLDNEQYRNVCKAVHDQFEVDPTHKCDNPDCDGIGIVTSDKIVVLPDVSDIHDCVGECTC